MIGYLLFIQRSKVDKEKNRIGGAKKMTLRIMILLIMGFNFLFPVSTAAELDNFHFKIIQIAFMNGYSRAIDSEIETITLLKQDNKYLKSYMEKEVEEYMQKVTALNRKSHSETASDSSIGSSFKPIL